MALSDSRKRELLMARDRQLEEEEFSQWIMLRMKDLELVDVPGTKKELSDAWRKRLADELAKTQKVRLYLQAILEGIPTPPPPPPPSSMASPVPGSPA